MAKPAPSLHEFGAAEVRRALVCGIVLVGAVLRASLATAISHPTLAIPGRIGVHARAALYRELSEAVAHAFVILGPTFCKLGQMIASSPGVFPAPLADACLRLLDDVPPIPAGDARAVVEEDLGAPISQLFASFDDVPLSAASVAQVHACVTTDGRQAVVKVQRPRIRTTMNRDLRIAYRLARLVDRSRKGRLVNAPAVIEDLHQVTNEELDFEFEATRQTRFRENIHAFGDNQGITAPAIYWERTGPRVICMERMHGIPLDEFDELRRRGVDGEMVLRRGIKVWIEAAICHGPFHGDVHAGNLWMLDDGRATYLDFGIMGELNDDYRDLFRDLQYTAMIDSDYERVVRAWQRVGVFGPDIDVGATAAMVKAMYEPLLDMPIGEVSLGELMKQQLDLQEQMGLRAPREFVLITKQLLYFERYAKVLAPFYNMSRDLYLVKNIFPDEVAKACADRGIELPE